MANILLNSIKTEKNSLVLDTFIDPRIFLNVCTQYKNILMDSPKIIEINDSYKFRPDKLAYELWHEDLWYPIILTTNNLGSVLQFTPHTMGYKCLVPDDKDLLKFMKLILTTQ